MMSLILAYSRPHDLSKLHDELLAALPSLVAIVEGDGVSLKLTVPDGTNRAPIDAVVAAHDPTPRPPPVNSWTSFRTALATAATVAELKAALNTLAVAREQRGDG